MSLAVLSNRNKRRELTLTMRVKNILALTPAVFASVSVLFLTSTVLVTRHMNALTLRSNAQSAALIGKSLQSYFKTSLFFARSFAVNHLSEEQLAQSKSLISTGIIEWSKDEFIVSKHLENPSILKEYRLTAPTVLSTLTAFRNEILNAGPTLEQIYPGLLANELPVLILISPWQDDTTSQINRSIVSIVSAIEPLNLIASGSENEFYAIDRFGTLILHTDQQRALHREAVSQNPVVRRIASTVAEHEESSSGSYFRIPFAGISIVSQNPNQQMTLDLLRSSLGIVLLALIFVTGILLTGYKLVTLDQT